jgi:hypothetical protein
MFSVMPGLVPGIHVFGASKKVVDGRVEPGHVELGPHSFGRSGTKAVALIV